MAECSHPVQLAIGDEEICGYRGGDDAGQPSKPADLGRRKLSEGKLWQNFPNYPPSINSRFVSEQRVN